MQTPDSLTLNDLKLMVQVIKVVSTRGAIQPDEMTSVGNLFNKLESFIASVTPPKEELDNGTIEPQQDEKANEGETNNG